MFAPVRARDAALCLSVGQFLPSQTQSHPDHAQFQQNRLDRSRCAGNAAAPHSRSPPAAHSQYQRPLDRPLPDRRWQHRRRSLCQPDLEKGWHEPHALQQRRCRHLWTTVRIFSKCRCISTAQLSGRLAREVIFLQTLRIRRAFIQLYTEFSMKCEQNQTLSRLCITAF